MPILSRCCSPQCGPPPARPSFCRSEGTKKDHFPRRRILQVPILVQGEHSQHFCPHPTLRVRHKKQSSLMTHLDVLSPRHHACCAASRAEAVSSYGWHPAAAGTGQTLQRGSSWWPPSTPSRWRFFDSWRQRLKAETRRAPRRTSSLSRCGPTSSCLLLTRSSDDF